MESGPVISTKVKLLVDTTTVALRTTSTTANARGVPPESEKSTMVPSTSEVSDNDPTAFSGSGKNTADKGNRTRSPERVAIPPVGRERQRFRPEWICIRRASVCLRCSGGSYRMPPAGAVCSHCRMLQPRCCAHSDRLARFGAGWHPARRLPNRRLCRLAIRSCITSHRTSRAALLSSTALLCRTWQTCTARAGTSQVVRPQLDLLHVPAA